MKQRSSTEPVAEERILDIRIKTMTIPQFTTLKLTIEDAIARDLARITLETDAEHRDFLQMQVCNLQGVLKKMNISAFGIGTKEIS